MWRTVSTFQPRDVAGPAAFRGAGEQSYLKGARRLFPQPEHSSIPDFPKSLSTLHTPRRSAMAAAMADKAVAGHKSRRTLLTKRNGLNNDNSLRATRLDLLSCPPLARHYGKSVNIRSGHWGPDGAELAPAP